MASNLDEAAIKAVADCLIARMTANPDLKLAGQGKLIGRELREAFAAFMFNEDGDDSA